MPGRSPITLKRPEGGAEHGVTFWVNHNCPAARVYKSDEAGVAEEFGDDIDLVLFPVGVTGYEMPAGVPFEVQSTNPCDACGTYLKSMFMWSTPKLFLPS